VAFDALNNAAYKHGALSPVVALIILGPHRSIIVDQRSSCSQDFHNVNQYCGFSQIIAGWLRFSMIYAS
jgi:hypothetical protein